MPEIRQSNALVEALLKRFEGEYPILVRLTGSHGEGLANSHSDIDMLVMCERADDASAGSDGATHTQVLAGQRVDVTRISASLLRSHLERRFPVFPAASLEDIDLCHRYLRGRVLSGHEAASALARDFPLPHLQAAAARRFMFQANECATDLEAHVESRDWAEAALCLRRLVRLLAELLLATEGDTYARPKWLYKRLQAHPALQPLAAAALAIELTYPLDVPAALRDHFERALRFARLLGARAWLAGEPAGEAPSDGRIVRPDAILLPGPQRELVVRRPGRRLLVNAATARRLCERAIAEAAVPAGAPPAGTAGDESPLLDTAGATLSWFHGDAR